MLTNEWALIIFTVFSQMAAGTFLVLTVLHIYAARRAGEIEADRMSDRTLIGIMIVLALSMLASILHLGDPLGAPRALNHLATSWLSREILMTLVFGGLGFIYVLLQWFKKGTIRFRRSLAILTSVAGLVLVFAQARSYMLPTRPTWNLLATPVAFYATTFLLGVLATGAALLVNYSMVQKKYPESAGLQGDLICDSIRWLAMASIILVGVELVLSPIYLVTLSAGSTVTQTSVGMMAGIYKNVYFLRLALGFTGAAIFSAFLYRNAASGTLKTLPNLTYGAFTLVLIAEILGRFLFYATSLRIGI